MPDELQRAMWGFRLVVRSSVIHERPDRRISQPAAVQRFLKDAEAGAETERKELFVADLQQRLEEYGIRMVLSDASATDQYRICRTRAEREEWQVVGEWSDEAVSGSTPVNQRPGASRAMVAGLSGEWEAFVVEGLDRISRNSAALEMTVRRLEHRRLRIISVSEGYNSGQRNRTLMRGMLGLMAQQLLEDLVDGTRRGLTGQVLRGFHAGRSRTPTIPSRTTADPVWRSIPTRRRSSRKSLGVTGQRPQLLAHHRQQDESEPIAVDNLFERYRAMAADLEGSVRHDITRARPILTDLLGRIEIRERKKESILWSVTRPRIVRSPPVIRF